MFLKKWGDIIDFEFLRIFFHLVKRSFLYLPSLCNSCKYFLDIFSYFKMIIEDYYYKLKDRWIMDIKFGIPHWVAPMNELRNKLKFWENDSFIDNILSLSSIFKNIFLKTKIYSIRLDKTHSLSLLHSLISFRSISQYFDPAFFRICSETLHSK